MTSSRDLWRALSGVVCVYKLALVSSTSLKRLITKRMVAGGQRVEQRIPTIRLPVVEPHAETGALLVVGENEVQDYRYHPLVSGGFLRAEDVQLEEVSPLENASSGVCLLAANDACSQVPELLARSWVSVYRLDGLLGRATRDHEINAKVVERCEFEHVTKHKLTKVLSRFESRFRSAAFQYSNVDLQSEEAFELARKGLPRPQLPGAQIVYSIKLFSFKPPFFSLRLQCAGEDGPFLREFIHSIGLEVGTVATCTKLQRICLGPFTGDDALIDSQFSMQNFIRNISYCRELLEENKTNPNLLESRTVRQQRAEGRRRDVIDGLGINDDDGDEPYDGMHPVWGRDYTSATKSGFF